MTEAATIALAVGTIAVTVKTVTGMPMQISIEAAREAFDKYKMDCSAEGYVKMVEYACNLVSLDQ